jgi:IclR family mhp operon transcriptional activator
MEPDTQRNYHTVMQDGSKDLAIVEGAQHAGISAAAMRSLLPPAATKSSYRGNVRSLERGLALLEVVNDSGGVRPSDAARILRLPRPTAHRLLETLEELGYVRRSPTDNRFCVTIKAQRLSGGYDTDVQLSEVAGPVLSQLLKDLVWPINITTHNAGMMVVRETTHPRSPLSVDRDMVGREVPMLRTASGRVYLAFCTAAERREILRLLRVRGDAADEPYLIPGAVEEMLLRCRKKNYGAWLNEEFVGKTSSVALPIMVNGYARASIAVAWLTTAIPVAKAVQQFVPPLAEVADLLGRRLTTAQWSGASAH